MIERTVRRDRLHRCRGDLVAVAREPRQAGYLEPCEDVGEASVRDSVRRDREVPQLLQGSWTVEEPAQGGVSQLHPAQVEDLKRSSAGGERDGGRRLHRLAVAPQLAQARERRQLEGIPASA